MVILWESMISNHTHQRLWSHCHFTSLWQLPSFNCSNQRRRHHKTWIQLWLILILCRGFSTKSSQTSSSHLLYESNHQTSWCGYWCISALLDKLDKNIDKMQEESRHYQVGILGLGKNNWLSLSLLLKEKWRRLKTLFERLFLHQIHCPSMRYKKLMKSQKLMRFPRFKRRSQ